MNAHTVLMTMFLAAPAMLPAQAPPQAPAAMAADTPPPGPMFPDTARMRMRRQEVEQRFGQIVQQQLQLTEPQMQQLRAAMRAHQERRRELAQRVQAVNQAIRGQMQPGIAADQDSLNKLIESRNRLRVERVEQEQQLEHDLTFLDPARRLRFMQMLQRFEDQVQEIVRRRQGAMMMGPGQGPGPNGTRRPWPPRQMNPRP